MRNAPFEVRPIAGALGAELSGVNLAGDLADTTIGAIRQALLDHLVIFFRDQDLPPEHLQALARRFGTPIEYPFVKGIAGFPEIINVTKLEHETTNFGGVWHSDTTYLQEPPMATLLIAREVPEAGGDTLFANQYLAYETLSEKLRELLAGLRGVSSSAKADASRTREDRIRSDGSADARKLLEAEHPVVRTQGALCQPCAHRRDRGHNRGGRRTPARVPVPPPDPSGIHLPLSLDAGLFGDLGQSLRTALRGERLPRPAPCHAAHHARRRSAGMRLPEDGRPGTMRWSTQRYIYHPIDPDQCYPAARWYPMELTNG